MHSSPIDLLARAPGQPKTQPSDSDSDQRFSELLRQPAEDAAAPSPTGQGEPAATPVPEEHDPGGAAEAGQPAASEGAAVADSKDNLGQGTETFIEALAIIPDAITRGAQTVTPNAPQAPVTVPVAGSTAAGPVEQTGLSAGVPSDRLIPSAPQPAGAIQPGADASALPGRPATPVTTSNNPGVTTPAAPSQTIAPVAAQSMPEGADTTANAKPAVTLPTEAATAVLSGEGKPATVAGASATPASATTLAADGAASTVASAGLAASTKPMSPPRMVADTSVPAPMTDAIDGAELEQDIDLPAALLNKTASQKAAGTPVAGQGAAVMAASSGAKPAVLTAPEPVRPEAAISDRPPANAPSDPVAAAPSPSARPVVEAASLVQTGTGNTPPPAAEQVVLQLRKAVANGVDRMTVQLKPATLGRVDVQMEVGHDGRVQAVISAERPETLHLLQRDARTLTTALADAGLQADSGSLSFNLRGQTGDQAGGNRQPSSDGPTSLTDAGAEDGDDAITPITLTLGEGRVDIKV